MSEYDFDFFVIGGGSGGVRAARIAASLGARVGLCEERYMGGTCVNVGCVPKKLFVYGSSFTEEMRAAAAFGWKIEPPKFDWDTLVRNKDAEIARLNSIYDSLLGGVDVSVFRARGTVQGPHEVKVGDRVIRAKNILIATGGWPFVPGIPGAEHALTSNEIFSIPTLPKHIVIVGGGYIGVEFACIFNNFGSRVTHIVRQNRILAGFEEECCAFLAKQMVANGIEMHMETSATAVEKTEHGVRVLTNTGESFEADYTLFATGRVPNSAHVGLEGVGVELGKRNAVVVDENLRTNIPSIYAVGDVIDRKVLTPVALEEGMLLARNLFGGASQKVDYRDIPTAIFSQPNFASVGMTESEARKDCEEIDIYRSTFTPMKASLARHMGQDVTSKIFMKLIVDKKSDRVVGCHMVGPEAGEIIQCLGIAVKCGATKAQFDATIGVHPTTAEEFVTMRTPS